MKDANGEHTAPAMGILINLPGAQNPLYHRIVLDELRILGSRGALVPLPQQCAGCRNLAELYVLVFSRLEERHQHESFPNAVPQLFRLLWVAKRGLSEAEARDLLGTNHTPLPAAYWSPLRLAIGSCVAIRGGLLSLMTESARTAVEARYLSKPGAKTETHVALASWFRTRPPSARRFEELSWHLLVIDHAPALLALLTEPATLAVLPESMLEVWKSRAAWLEDRHQQRAWLYLEAEAFSHNGPAALTAGNLLLDLGYANRAATFYHLAMRDPECRPAARTNLAAALTVYGKIPAALEQFALIEEAAHAQRRWRDAAHAAMQQFNLQNEPGSSAEAEACAVRQQKYAEASGSADVLALCHQTRG
ncbi:MAG: hypothetical protein ACAI35_28125, partial [Candidatus Methylacidiphilales bacterium]